MNKVCTVIDCIGALPLPMRVRSFLIGAKAIPMITYGAHISTLRYFNLEAEDQKRFFTIHVSVTLGFAFSGAMLVKTGRSRSHSTRSMLVEHCWERKN